MRFRNFSIYVQRQIDRIFRSNQIIAKAYVDDIIIFSKTLQKHLTHLQKMFDILKFNNISIKLFKSFIDYSSITLFEQHVNSFDLVTDKQKLKTIINLTFSKTLRQFEIYLNLTKWFRKYIELYVKKSRKL